MNTSNGRVLVVDDNERNVAILKKILGRTHSIATAGSGEEALRIATRFVPDLVLLDISMPEMDGYEVCRRLRSMLALAPTKIIMVSARITVADRLAGYAAGADDYVVKPFEPEELLAKVRVYMRLKRVEEVDRLKSDLLMLLGQDARTPLAAIISPIEVALEEPALSDNGRRLLQMAREGALQLNEFLDRVLFLSRLHSGLVSLDFRNQDLVPLVSGLVGEMAPVAQQAGVLLHETSVESIMVRIDAEHIRRVVACLLDNAIRLSPREGMVTVAVTEQEGHARVSVSDQGPGVPAHFLGRVLGGLTVSDVVRQSPGHGLSLVIARAIARSHEGILSAENLESGGAMFTLELLVAQPSNQASPESLEQRTEV